MIGTGPSETNNDDILLRKPLGHLRALDVLGVQSTLPIMVTGPSGKRSLWRPT
jgi:hypothetical protein